MLDRFTSWLVKSFSPMARLGLLKQDLKQAHDDYVVVRDEFDQNEQEIASCTQAMTDIVENRRRGSDATIGGLKSRIAASKRACRSLEPKMVRQAYAIEHRSEAISRMRAKMIEV